MVIAYVQGVSEKIKHVLGQYVASVAFKPQQTLRQLIVAPQEQDPLRWKH